MVIHDRGDIGRFTVHHLDGIVPAANADLVRLAVLWPGVIAVFLLVGSESSISRAPFYWRGLAANDVSHGFLQA